MGEWVEPAKKTSLKHHTTKKNPPLFKKIDSENFSEIYDTRKLFLGAWRHLVLIVLSMVFWGALGFFGAYKFLYTYKAEAILVYQEEEEASKNIEGGFSLTNLSMPTVLDMIKLPKHFELIKTSLGLDLNVETIEDMVNVPIPRNESNLIRIVVKGDNPHLVVDIANSLAQASVKTNQEFLRKQLQLALDNYRNQMKVLQGTMTAQIQDIENFKTTHQFFEMDPQHAALLSQIQLMRKSRDTAYLQYDGLVEQYENLKKEREQLPDLIPITRDSKDSPLQVRIISLETTLAESRAKYTRDNPKILQIEQELDELLRKSKNALKDKGEEQFFEKNLVKDQIGLELMHLQGQVKSAHKVKEEIDHKLSEMEIELQKLPVKQMQLVKLLQAKSVTDEQIKFMAKAVESAQLMVNLPKGSIELYQLSDKAKPWKDAWWVDLLPVLGVFFGLGFGLGLAFFLETQDHKLRTPKQIAMAYGIPCTGTIPEMALTPKTAEKRTLFFIRQLAEALDKSFAKLGKVPISLAVISSVEGEGKSLVAYHIASYYGRLGKRVLYLDFDWRKNPFVPEPERRFKTLLEFLTTEIPAEEMLIPGDVDRVRIGNFDSRTKELIQSKKMASLWKGFNKIYDMIVIDAPGVIQDDYATNIAKLADQVLLVVGSSQVNKSLVDETLSALQVVDVRPCGILLNRVLPIYIDDERIRLETKRGRREMLKGLFFWRR